ncbi:helix-turn-helix domain-containing protein [Vibrio amylolyticus]|uniref:helix-turn-helix domain-containing protein n=1 Tax=Vibrio amylolyticus TaxID=2847292 RepID=UPI00354E2DD0
MTDQTVTGIVNTGQKLSFIPFGNNIAELSQDSMTNSNLSPLDKLEQVKIVTDSVLLHENFGMDYLSSLFCVSERTIQRLFIQENDSFKDYINRQKAQKTKALMEQGLSVEEVSVILNYSDPAKLSRAVKNTTGLSPTQLKDV